MILLQVHLQQPFASRVLSALPLACATGQQFGPIGAGINALTAPDCSIDAGSVPGKHDN